MAVRLRLVTYYRLSWGAGNLKFTAGYTHLRYVGWGWSEGYDFNFEVQPRTYQQLLCSHNMAHRDSTASEISLQVVDPAPVPDSRHSSIAIPPSGQAGPSSLPSGWASALGLTGSGHSSVYYCLCCYLHASCGIANIRQ